MFTWICPKCGNEVPPSYSDCPKCAESAAQAPETPAPEPVPPAAPAATVAPVAQAAPAAARPSARPGVHLPGWALSLLFAATFIILGLTALLIFRPSQPQPAAAATPAALETPAQPAPVVQALPAFKSVEISGLRLVEDAKQKAFLQMVVVNHSAADLGEISARADLKAITAKDQEPVGTFAFKTPLGPYESKDLKVPLATKLRVYELPDWQFLRVEITGK